MSSLELFLKKSGHPTVQHSRFSFVFVAIPLALGSGHYLDSSMLLRLDLHFPFSFLSSHSLVLIAFTILRRWLDFFSSQFRIFLFLPRFLVKATRKGSWDP